MEMATSVEWIPNTSYRENGENSFQSQGTGYHFKNKIYLEHLKLDEDDEDTPSRISNLPDDFLKNFETLHRIGKGSFSFVKFAKRHKDQKEVVVKFVRKENVPSEQWVYHKVFGIVPMEIVSLNTLKHPNIIKAFEFYESGSFFKVVMEKFGDSMDLGYFMNQRTIMDEALISYLFRQIVSGTSFLHKLNITHRDLKIDNIIMNQSFQIKIIDFGSSAFMYPGKKFSGFFGTTAYCSPEVLIGKPYEGPEQELWTLGVILYALVFQKLPFQDEQEILDCVLNSCFDVSQDLWNTIAWLLHRDVQYRASITDMEKNRWVWQTIDIAQYDWNEVLQNSELL